MGMAVQGKSGGKKRPMAEINITPFTDVCLVLLIIFMVSASFMNTQRALDVKLPSPGTPTEVDKRPKRDVTLAVLHDGTVKMTVTQDSKPISETVFSQDQLLPAVESEANKSQIKNVTIKAENGVIYNSVIGVMDTVKQAGIEDMALAVQAPPAAPGASTPKTTPPA